MNPASIKATYFETIQFLYTKLPMFERSGPVAFKKDLTNTLALCQRLGNPQLEFKSIHIAGTNGKGSVCSMLASILMEAGYKTGLYMSPHYKDFGERIRVNGKYINRTYFIEFVQKHQDLIQEIKPSFFEITVALAFKYFADKKVDIAIIETGLGGRLDSTNVITPMMSIITNIGYDHQNLLGNTLPKIAAEKAGIIKEKVPVLIGEFQPDVMSVFERKAKSMNSQLRIASKLGKVMTQVTTSRYVYRTASKKYTKLDMPFHGIYQERNINTVIQTIDWINELNLIKIGKKALLDGLKHIDRNVPLIGRWQILNTKPWIVAEAAHNLDGIRMLTVKIRNLKSKKLHIVFGTVKDKDITPVLKLLPKDALYYFVKADLPRAMDDRILLEKANLFRLQGAAYGPVKSGLSAAKKNARKNEAIIITGSIFVVGEVI